MSTGNSQGSSNKTLFIILGIVGGVLVLGCLGCVGLVGWGFFKARQATQQISNQFGAELAAEAFLRSLGFGQMEAAYEQTTSAFRNRQTLEQFRAFVDQHPPLRDNRSVSSNTTRHDGNRLTITATVETSTGQIVTVTLEMVEELGQWKVDRFTIP